MSYRDYARMKEGKYQVLDEVASKLGIVIMADRHMPEDRIVLMKDGQFVGMIELEQPFNAEGRLVDAFAGKKPIVWS